jgi:hypothetical protein
MPAHIILEQQLHCVLALVEQPEPYPDGVDTRTLLYQLAVEPEWTTALVGDLDFISKRRDISEKLFQAINRVDVIVLRQY